MKCMTIYQQTVYYFTNSLSPVIYILEKQTQLGLVTNI